jgi:hypothetical protein
VTATDISDLWTAADRVAHDGQDVEVSPQVVGVVAERLELFGAVRTPRTPVQQDHGRPAVERLREPDGPPAGAFEFEVGRPVPAEARTPGTPTLDE